MNMPLQDLCERIVRDAIPATDSGATCFVPRYQIDQLREALSAHQPHPEAQAQGGGEDREPDDGKVICPACCHQFRAIPVQVQRDMIAAGFEPPFTAPPSAPVGVEAIVEAIISDPANATDTDTLRRCVASALAQQPASDGGFTAADMMDARQEGRKEAQQPAAEYERLAEALRVIEGFTMSQFPDAADMAGACVETAHNALHPAAAQENDDA